MARSARLPRLTRLSPVAAVGLALALAGCSPITTAEPYAASDGIRVEVGDQVRAQNLMIVTRGEGEPGVLLGGLVNDGKTDTNVTLSVGSETVVLAIAAGQTLLLSAPDAAATSTLAVEEVAITAVPGIPGSFTDLQIATPESGSVTVGIPILDGTLESYDPVAPGSPSPVEETEREGSAEESGH